MEAELRAQGWTVEQLQEVERKPLHQIVQWMLEQKIILPCWHPLFVEKERELQTICRWIDGEITKGKKIVPRKLDIFRVFTSLPLERIKVVIVGQDPYPNPGQAVGLSFSIPPRYQLTSSLVNIFQEVKNCYPEFVIPNQGDLSPWVQQGVFLLNSCLTTMEGTTVNSGLHGKRWSFFLVKICQAIGVANPQVVFIAWGEKARKFVEDCDLGEVNLLTCAHPSGKNAYGFLGCKHFSIVNTHLRRLRDKSREPNPLHEEIDWSL